MRALVLFAALACATALRAEEIAQPDCSAPDLQLQQVDGTVDCAGDVLTFTAGAKRGPTVGKADVILPFDPLGAGARLTIRAEVRFPPGTPLNSIHLVDTECKHCGWPGNPGLRLYLREGALRVDRHKIGESDAWARRDPPRLRPDTWHRLEWRLLLAEDATGRSTVLLDGAVVLDDRGRTLPVQGTLAAVDRVQIGVTANSNPRPATARFRAIRVEIARP